MDSITMDSKKLDSPTTDSQTLYVDESAMYIG
jgi:hypothetical protein